MSEHLDQLIELLTLEKIDEGLYRGQSEMTDWGRVYGGQVIAQSLAAAQAEVDARRSVHSFHSYFLRPGDPDVPILYSVENNLDAGTISNRRVTAKQKGRPIFVMSSSFQLPIESFTHQVDMPDVPGPQGLPRELELREEEIRRAPEEWLPKWNAVRAIDFRTVDAYDWSSPAPSQPRRQLWMKPNGVLPSHPVISQYLLAYASDFWFLSTAAQPHGISFLTDGMRMATIDHSLWFHRPFIFNDWLLYDMTSPSSANGRGFVTGNIYDRQGRLVASAAQEGVVRLQMRR